MANFCSQCGNPLREGDLFCSKCGRPLTSSAGQTEEKQAYQSSATQGAWGVNPDAAGSAAASSAAGNTTSTYSSGAGSTSYAYHSEPKSTPYSQPAANEPKLTINQFFKKYVSGGRKAGYYICLAVAVGLFIFFLVATIDDFNLASRYQVSFFPVNLIHALLYVPAILTYLIRKDYIVPGIVSGIEMIFFILSMCDVNCGGSVPIGFIAGAAFCFQIQKAYKTYLQTGQVE